MNDTWKKIQPLKIPAGWLIEYNNFYIYEPTPENMEWFYGSYVICASNIQAKLAFESWYEPEGDPEGCFIIDFFSTKYNHKSKEVETNKRLGTLSTKRKQEFIDIIEHFMFFQKIPNN